MLLTDVKPLINLPQSFQVDWQAELHKATPSDHGHFEVIQVTKTKPLSGQELRIVIHVMDENGYPLSGVEAICSYSTAEPYTVSDDFVWSPPSPRRGDRLITDGAGQVEHIQGSVVKAGEPGGITVYIFEPLYPSDYITGAGALADHTGMRITFRLRRAKVKSLMERVSQLELEIANIKELAAPYYNADTNTVDLP
jgi:hypothetical protein